MKTLYIMVGTPGSGKSTFIASHIVNMTSRINVESRDNVRFSLVKENEEYFSKEKEVFRQWTDNIRESLAAGMDVFADATHLTVASRCKLINALQGVLDDVRIVCIVMDTCLAKCLQNNELRKGTRAYVPQSVIRRMYSQFEMPTFDEDIDEIVLYRNKEMLIKERI